MIEDSTFYTNQGLRVRLCHEEEASGHPGVPMAPPRLMFRVFRVRVEIPHVRMRHQPWNVSHSQRPSCCLEGPDPYHVTMPHPKPWKRRRSLLWEEIIEEGRGPTAAGVPISPAGDAETETSISRQGMHYLGSPCSPGAYLGLYCPVKTGYPSFLPAPAPPLLVSRGGAGDLDPGRLAMSFSPASYCQTICPC